MSDPSRPHFSRRDYARMDAGRPAMTAGAVRGAVPVPPIWPPTKVPGCVLWLDMLDTATYTVSAGTVTSITNQVSGVAWAEGVNPPTYDATIINGHPAMTGDGAAKNIISTEAAVLNAFADSINAQLSVILVAALTTTPNGTQCLFGWGSSLSGNAFNRHVVTTLGSPRRINLQRGDTAVSANNRSIVSGSRRSGPCVIAAITNDVTTQIYHNGVQDARIPVTSFLQDAVTPDRMFLLANMDSSPDSFADATQGLGLVLAFRGALSDHHLAGLHSAIRQRWGNF